MHMSSDLKSIASAMLGGLLLIAIAMLLILVLLPAVVGAAGQAAGQG